MGEAELNWSRAAPRRGPSHGLAALGVAGRFAKVGDEEADAVGELNDFAFALNIELDFVVARGGVIDGLLQADQRLNNLFRQGEADPDADQESDRGDDREGPLGGRYEAPGFAMVVLDTVPTLGLEFAGHGEDFLPGALQVDRDVAQGRITFLNSLGDLGIERPDAIAKFIDQLSTRLEAIAFQQIVEIFLVSHQDGVDAVCGSLPGLADYRYRGFKAFVVSAECGERFLRHRLVGRLQVADGAHDLLNFLNGIAVGLERSGIIEEEIVALGVPGFEHGD